MKLKRRDNRSVMPDKFECPLCKKLFADPSELRLHRQEAHRSVMDEISYRTVLSDN
jgi:hypothetical protein